MKILALTALLVFSSLSIKAQTQVTNFTPGVDAYGVNYALPKTGLNIQVLSNSTSYYPGEFSKYAERYLHIKNVRRMPETKHVISEIRVQSYGIPDTTKYYTIKLKDKSIAPFVELSDDGVILSINTTNDTNRELTKIVKPEYKNTKLNSNEYLTEEILSANSISKMAELTAAEIYDIRESKNAIMKGQVETMPKDGASLKIVIDELEKHEAALMQLFIGYEERGSEIKTFNYIPSEDEENKLLFRHSGKLGFVDNDDLAGNAYMIDVKNLHTTPIVEENPKEKKKLNGVMYNMPSLANVKIYTAQQTYLEKKIPVAQYGNEDILTNTLFNKGATTKVIFNHATGAIEKIEQ